MIFIESISCVIYSLRTCGELWISNSNHHTTPLIFLFLPPLLRFISLSLSLSLTVALISLSLQYQLLICHPIHTIYAHFCETVSLTFTGCQKHKRYHTSMKTRSLSGHPSGSACLRAVLLYCNILTHIYAENFFACHP